MNRLLTSADLDVCAWAACGQTALASLLRVPLAEVGDVVSKDHAWMTYAGMREALTKLRAKFKPTGYEDERGDTRTPPCRWPRHGLALLQFRGPWEDEKVPHVACLKHTHWIAVAGRETVVDQTVNEIEPFVFDVNALAKNLNHGWLPRSYWERRILAPLIAAHRRATGAWYARAGIEVSSS